MAQPPPPPPWNPTIADFDIHYEGVNELAAATGGFPDFYGKTMAEKIIPGITREMRQQAQLRSPYLYGVLRWAHTDEVFNEGDDVTGVVGIDPNVWHPILGGRPANYGPRIHNEEGRPWFLETINQEASPIMQKYGAELEMTIGNYFNTQRIASSIFTMPAPMNLGYL